MTLFFIAAALLVVAALAFIVPSALKRPNDQTLDQLETNITIAKDRRAQLQQSLQSGALDQATYDSEINELEHALARDLTAAEKQGKSSQGGIGVAAFIALFLPIASGAIYLQLGNPKATNTQAMHQAALTAQNQAQAAGQPPPLQELLPELEKKLAESPDDRDGWKLLGKTYLTISDFANAKRALLRAYDLNSEDPELLSQLAEATAMEKGGDLSGEAGEYIESALAIDPGHAQSLWLKAIQLQQTGQHEKAIEEFESLRAGVAGNPEAVASVNQMINASRAELGLDALPIAAAQVLTQPAPSVTQTQPAQPSAENGAENKVSVVVTVSLSDDVTDKVNDTDSVFIFATATNGPPMPLAVSRHTVSELPVTVELNDAMAMMPAMTLSQFPSVTIGARVSASGNAIAQAGDWFGEALNITPSEAPEIEVKIDTLTQ